MTYTQSPLYPENMVNTMYINPPTSQYYKYPIGGDRTLRCAIYARVSTELDSQKTSIENQIDIFRHFAAQRGWEIVEIYTDKKSGTKENRPGLKKLIADGKAGKYDLILAKELSRLARNGRLSYELKDTILEHNLHIICLDNSINTLEGNDKNFGLFAWLYETESATSSFRNKEAKKAKSERGLFIGSNPPYGYKSEKGILKIRDDETPEIVRRIFSNYLEGKGMDSIAKSLTSERIPTPSQVAGKSNASSLWHASTVKNILNNRHYTGDLVQNRTETISVTSTKRREFDKEQFISHQDTHEAIISKETFNSVEKMLQHRTRVNTAPKKHLFTNLLFCEECEKGMWYKGNQRGYRCGGNIKHGDTFCVNQVVVREKELKNIIHNDLKELFKSFKNESLLETLQNKLSTKKRQIKNEIEKVEKHLKDLRKRKLDYVNLYTDNLISKEDLVEYKELSDQSVKELNQALNDLQEKLKECEGENYTFDLGSKLKEFLSLTELTPQVLHSLVERITCNSQGDIRIHYNFVNPFQES
ncbi:recombinase family protein [Bacillus sp. JJ1764]|uniref:recombinase family protein n=1 Tax=Bacillus sp. JJ1764 TaxID=3122964 RepID=UPI002FFF164A